jgi:hypothetical protein
MTEHGEAYEGERKKGEQTAAAMGGGPKKKEVKEAKLDPVGQEDADIDNDGDTDKTDKYLHNRRKAIGKAIAKKKGKKVDEAFLADGATGTTSTEGQNAREIDVLPDKVAKKLQQVTVMPQDGTNPQVGKAPLMMSQEMEGEQLDELKAAPMRKPYATLGSGEVKVRPPKMPSMKNPIMNKRRPDGSPAPIGVVKKLTEEEEDRRERYAFMNVARNLVRAKTGAKRPIAMDPEGTYKKAKEDLAKMVNSGNPDKDKEETPCEEKQLSMADTFLSIANAPKEDSEQLDEFLGPQAAKNVDALLKGGQKVLNKLGIPTNKTKKQMPGSGTPDTQKADQEARRLGQNRMRQAGY